MNYDKLLKNRIEKNPFAQLIGMKLTKAVEGAAWGELDVSDSLLNPIGSVHGGCLATLADVTSGTAACTYGNMVTTMDCDMHFMRAALNTKKVFSEAHVIKKGRRVIVVEVSLTNDRKEELCRSFFTFMALEKIPFFAELSDGE